MSENSFYQDESGVFVTTTRFQVPGTTYPINGITSVSNVEIKPNRMASYVIILFGLVGLIAGSASFGAVMLVIGGVIFAMQKTEYAVSIFTAGGQINAIKSADDKKVTKIVTALNEAIIQRG